MRRLLALIFVLATFAAIGGTACNQGGGGSPTSSGTPGY